MGISISTAVGRIVLVGVAGLLLWRQRRAAHAAAHSSPLPMSKYAATSTVSSREYSAVKVKGPI